MADANNKVKITDFTTPIINTRERYLLENDNKIKGRKGFLFGSFKTEKERIQKAIEYFPSFSVFSDKYITRRKNRQNCKMRIKL